MYSRVHCRGDRCYPAPVEPPCMPGVPCFKEDPKTLEWKLEDRVAENVAHCPKTRASQKLAHVGCGMLAGSDVMVMRT